MAARSIRAQLKERTRHHFTRLRPGPSAPPLPKAECGALLAQLEAWCRAQPIRPFGRILDASQRVAGVGSLGTPRRVNALKNQSFDSGLWGHIRTRKTRVASDKLGGTNALRRWKR